MCFVLRQPTHTAKLIKEFRARNGMSQEKFAKALGIQRRQVVRWEGGEHFPQPGNVEELARYMGLDPEDFYPIPEERPGEVRERIEHIETMLEQMVEQSQHISRLESELTGVRELLAQLVGHRAGAESVSEAQDAATDGLARELKKDRREPKRARSARGA
jgi:transcriptional regulator with XRE-family HTH domain